MKSAEELPSRPDLKLKEKEYKEFCDWLKQTLREKHFKEYYELWVELYKDATKSKITNWTVMVDLNMEEVIFILNFKEHESFMKSLGTDYDYVWSGLNEYFGNAIDLS